jgi:arylsulfatase A-like enzyme
MNTDKSKLNLCDDSPKGSCLISHRFWKCTFLMITLVVGGVCSVAYSEPVNKSSKPNFLVFIADDLNKEYYGCYGNEKTATPTTSRLAEEGMVFDNAFTGQAICAPSRTMLYTGKYPLRNGAFKNHSEVYEGTRSVCHYLQKLAYDVILCGKSHVNPSYSPRAFEDAF